MNKLVNFSVLNPEGIVRLVTDDEDFKLDKWIAEVQGKTYKFINNPSILDSLIMYITIFIVVLIFLMLMCCCLLIPQFFEYFKKKLIAFKEKLFWNGVIKSITVSYITLGLAACA